VELRVENFEQLFLPQFDSEIGGNT
jgi:hypothetical protein